MSIRSELARWSAGDDQRLPVFKAFYLAAGPTERVRLREYVAAVAALHPSDLDESVRFDGGIGCSGSRVIGVQFACSHLPDGPSASVDPHLLLLAIESWDNGEEFAPPA